MYISLTVFHGMKIDCYHTVYICLSTVLGKKGNQKKRKQRIRLIVSWSLIQCFDALPVSALSIQLFSCSFLSSACSASVSVVSSGS